MGPTQLVALLGIPFLAMTTWAQPSQQPATTIAAAADQEISLVEKEFVTAAEAMPEDKFDFSPEKLNIPGSAFKDVRTFAWEVKHVAASNYFLWSLVTGDPIPQNVSSEKGLDQMKTKADILRFLKESFVLGHKAAARLTAANMLDIVRQIHPHLPGHLWSCACVGSLRTDGGVFTDERNCAASQPVTIDRRKEAASSHFRSA